MSRLSLNVVNAETATFECTFGRGCEGLCCKNGRPSVRKSEQKAIKSQWKRILPLLTPAAAAVAKKEGFLSKRKKLGKPMVRVVDGWCLFFNEGCVLHKLGAEDGDFSMYKPIQCTMFPLEPAGDGSWYVRQWETNGEAWDIFCLNPKNSKLKAKESLAPEIEVAAKLGPKFNWDNND
jgi:hypothetical protein